MNHAVGLGNSLNDGSAKKGRGLMFVMTLRLTVPPEKAGDVFSIVKSMAGPMLVDASCKHFNLYRSMSDENVLMLIVEWTSQGALERHIQSDDFRNILEVMELPREVPEIHFDNVAERAGFELVERVRSKAG